VPAGIAASPSPAATRHYDCSKAGNANKAACKTAPATATQAAPAKKTRAAPESRTTAAATITKTTTRHYDCTKAGNANKAACRTAAAQTTTGKTSGAVKTTTKTTATTTDCTKWYNRMRATCRTASSSPPPKTTVAPASKPAPAATRPASSAENNNPTGATAQCKDGTYSHAKTHQGACSHHGGVAKWL
jgi:Protein of unknown function (DUF3761)